MTESKTPLTSEKMSEPTAKVSSSKDVAKKTLSGKKDNPQKSPTTSSNKVSKLAMLAVLIAVAAPSGHYYWQQQQNKELTQTLTSEISKENSATLNRYQKQMQLSLASQQQSFAKQLQEVAIQIQNTSQAKITELDTTVRQLEQRVKQQQPSDWLLHEAEYLIRIAARTLWLQHDTSAAIGLLKDADARLTELNDPAYLPVRETIHQDINSLELMPTLDTDDVVLTLMAMNKQVSQLPIAIEDLGNKDDDEANLVLSDDISDWQSNIAKTWQKFFNNFIRVRARTGSVEPLMSPDQQENLKQNLSLKIQLALWATSDRKGDIYQEALVDIEQWLNEFFDMKESINQHFKKSLISLKGKKIAFDYPSDLRSLTAIRTTLSNQLNNLPTTQKETGKVESKSQLEAKEEIKPTTEKPVQLPAQTSKQQPEQQKIKSSSEGNL